MTRNFLSLSDPVTSSFVFGASGLLGNALFRRLRSPKSGTFFTKKVSGCFRISSKNLSNAKIIKIIKDYDDIYYCIALSDPSKCTRSPNLSLELNYRLPVSIAKVCKAMNKKLILYSTEYVFESHQNYINEKAKPNNITTYSLHKIHCENEIKRILPKTLILRCAKIINDMPGTNDFLSRWKKSIKNNKKVEIFKDQKLRPVLVTDIVIWTKLLVKKNAYGIYHLAGAGETDRLRLYNKYLKKDLQKIIKNKISLIKSPAHLPQKLRLSNRKVILKTGYSPCKI